MMLERHSMKVSPEKLAKPRAYSISESPEGVALLAPRWVKQAK
jgi:hypothetical protein